jgi:signal peptidase I
MVPPNRIRQFFFPSLTPRFLLRISLVAIGSYLFFGHICTPLRIEGYSMEPTYHNGGINFCWRLQYLFSEPQRGNIVLVRLAGSRVMLLKRVVAVEGEEVAFHNGKLIVDGAEIDEPYVKNPCDWELSPRQVAQGNVYVVGDNRREPLERHYFGQVSLERIVGGALW